MPALIGYLVTIAVFLGGGYAGMQWLTAPEDISSAVAIHRSIEPVSSTRARLLARKKHEAAAEREVSARAAVTAPPAQEEAVGPTVESVAMTADAEPATVNEAVQSAETLQSIAVPATQPSKLADVPSEASAAAIVGVKATIAPAVAMQPAKPLDNHATATAGIAASTATPRNQRSSQSKTVKNQPARPLLARDDDESPNTTSGGITKRRAATRLASRRPVLMILRTIEFPDGRREQRLLPMPRYRQALADD